jgi:hypothetical protein
MAMATKPQLQAAPGRYGDEPQGIYADRCRIAVYQISGGGIRAIYAGSDVQADRARAILRQNPAMLDHLHGVDGITIYVYER